MMLYRWHGVTGRGQPTTAWAPARSEATLRARLRRRGIVVLGARPVTGRHARRHRVSTAVLARFARHLATLLAAGVPVLQACRMAANAYRGRHLESVLREVAQAIEAGARVADAFRRHPDCFPNLFLTMLDAADAGGGLAEATARLAEGLERQARTRAQLRRAAVYPATILVVGTAATALLLVFVVPAFEQSFASFGARLPLPTRMVIAFSHAAALGAPIATLAIAAAAFALRRSYADATARLRVDTQLLRLPLVGELLSAAAASRVAGCLAALLSAGVPILSALRTSAPLAGNRAVAAAVTRAATRVGEGQTLAAALAESALLPAFLCDLVALGEQTGGLDAMLGRAAVHFEEELERRIAMFTAALEPAAVVFLGVTLGGVVLAMYLPVFQLGSML